MRWARWAGVSEGIGFVAGSPALAANAIEEGLKPFAHRTVMSVAGVELAFNSAANWLTRTVSARSLFFQIVAYRVEQPFGLVHQRAGGRVQAGRPYP